jgi:hypothetical protein
VKQKDAQPAATVAPAKRAREPALARPPSPPPSPLSQPQQSPQQPPPPLHLPALLFPPSLEAVWESVRTKSPPTDGLKAPYPAPELTRDAATAAAEAPGAAPGRRAAAGGAAGPAPSPAAARLLPAVIFEGPNLNASSGKPAWCMALTSPDAAVPSGDEAPATVAAFQAVLEDLEAKGVQGSDDGQGLVQGGLQSWELTKPPGRTQQQQQQVANTPAIRSTFEALKLRAYQLLVATGREPDAHRFDKILWLLSVAGNADQDKHFDDATLLKLLYYMFPTVPTKVTTMPVPYFDEAWRWVEANEPRNGAGALALLLVSGWRRCCPRVRSISKATANP